MGNTCPFTGNHSWPAQQPAHFYAPICMSALKQIVMRKRIVAVHLLNDRSGSPQVLGQALTTLSKEYDIVLFTATPYGDGFLSDLPGVIYKSIFYRRSNNKSTTLLLYILSQWILFWRLFFFLRRTDTLYINTLRPFGAAIAGWLRRTRIIYHLHETSIRPQALRKLPVYVADLTASKIIFVSAYLEHQFHFNKRRTQVIHNSLSQAFVERAEEALTQSVPHPFTITMLCSLKAYKGVYCFVNIARHLPSMKFVLVLNATQAEVSIFIAETTPPENCIIYPCQQDTIPFYAVSDVVMDLSDPGRWIEAFGMTLLEAMSWGIPVICPVVGGVLEVVEDQVNGFAIDCHNTDAILTTLMRLQNDNLLYRTMSSHARTTAGKFPLSSFQGKISAAFH